MRDNSLREHIEKKTNSSKGRILVKKLITVLTILIWATTAFAAKSVIPQEEFLDYCATGKLSQVGKGVRRGGDLNRMEPTGLSPLICAARDQDDPRVIRYLVRKGAAVDGANFQGMTPLTLAATYNPNVRITVALLESGADPRHEDMLGRTPLTWAAYHNTNPGVMKQLLDAIGDPNSSDSSGMTPLTAAASNPEADMTRLLLESGAQVDRRDADGRTPLSYAAERNSNVEVIRLLLDAGADPLAAGPSGRTPLAYAAASNGPEVLDVLLDHTPQDAKKARQAAKRLAQKNPALKGTSALQRLDN